MAPMYIPIRERRVATPGPLMRGGIILAVARHGDKLKCAAASLDRCAALYALYDGIEMQPTVSVQCGEMSAPSINHAAE